jgi:hypothetical protein
MADETLWVTKTLVLGLGTTGTTICSQIAERIRWEHGNVSRVPWVRFLCLETNASGAPRNLEPGDFIPLTLTANEYSGLAQYSPAYDEAIRLSRWADAETLNRLPHKAVDDGVGNIRMVGRLAFFHKRNYDAVRNAVERRLNDLRQLSGPEASERLGRLPDGTTPSVAFAAKGAVRIFVVGTLCGGTCSGLAGDIGYFLQSLTREEEKVIGIFTLPHPSLSVAAVPAASRFKKNAYTALVEMNHYHLLAGVEKDEIPFPGHAFPTTGRQPYDLPFLAMPRDTGGQSLRELETAIQDRIFLNAFVPETDSFAETVNVGIMDRDGHAHTFCTFGLATLEFPAQQVMEACAARLTVKALRDWKARTLPEHLAGPRLEEIGLTWPRLRARLLTGADGTPLATRLRDQLGVIEKAAETSEQDLSREIAVIRAAFGEPGFAGVGAALPPNVVPQTVAAAVPSVAQQVYQDLRAMVEARFLQYDEGPGRLSDLLSRAKERLADLQQVAPRDPRSQAEATDAAAQKVQLSRRKRFPWSREMVVDREEVRKLRAALEAEIEARLDREAQRAMQSAAGDGRAAPGLAARIQRLLDPVKARVENLRARVTAYQTLLEGRVRRLAEDAPEVNGIPLFDPDRQSGTAAREYRRCLEEESGDPTITWDAAEDAQAREVIDAWREAPSALFPRDAGDWLRDLFVPGSEEPLRPEDAEALLARARRPFQRLRAVNLLEHWEAWPDAAREVERACGMMAPFLYVDEVQATRGGREAIKKRTIALVPGGEVDHEFCRLIRARAGVETFRPCPDRFRAVLIAEWYRFPLYGAPEIVGGTGSLATAQATDFPTFHTRKDVFWTGLSDEELRRTQEAEERVVAGALLRILTPEAGALVLRWTPRGTGQPSQKRLPLSIRGAARALVFERSEVDGDVQELAGAAGILGDRIEQERKKTGDDEGFVRALVAAHASGDFNILPDWREDNLAGRLVDRFCARDAALFRAWLNVFPPDPDQIRQMMKRKGEPRPTGGIYPEDGLYCIDTRCCSWIGKDEQEAAQNGWRCYINQHDYSGRSE